MKFKISCKHHTEEFVTFGKEIKKQFPHCILSVCFKHRLGYDMFKEIQDDWTNLTYNAHVFLKNNHLTIEYEIKNISDEEETMLSLKYL